MGKRFSYSIPAMTRRLLKTAEPVKGTLWVSTLASIVGNLSQMGLMGFGALLLLSCAGMVGGPPWGYAGLMGFSALLIVLGRYIEGVVSHAGAYRLLASMRVHLYGTIRKLAPACLMDREKGDLLNIAVSDIETVEFFFAHTIGPMFTVILLPCVTLGLALWFQPLFAAVLLPVYLVVSVVFPLAAVKAGRGMGMRYRARLGEMKSLVLESVYGLRDIQIFGFGPPPAGAGAGEEPAGQPSGPRHDPPPAGGVRGARLLCLPGPHPHNWGGILAGGVRRAQPGGDGGTFLCGGGLFFLHPVSDYGGLQPA